MDEEGNIHLVGRGKGVIIQRGSNVYPREIEDRLYARPVVQEVAVVGVGDELLGEAICALSMPAEGATVTEGEIWELWWRRLADYKIPNVITFLEEFPMTGPRKVRPVELARLLEEASRSPSI